jgi:hypothetical protein
MLKEGHRHLSGLDEAVVKNIEACKQLSKITRTSMGPNGTRPVRHPHFVLRRRPLPVAPPGWPTTLWQLCPVAQVEAHRGRLTAAWTPPYPRLGACTPTGMNKMVINHLEKLFVTSDAATIVRELEVAHPAAKLVVLAAQAQEAEIGDGTNLVRARLTSGVPSTELTNSGILSVPHPRSFPWPVSCCLTQRSSSVTGFTPARFCRATRRAPPRCVLDFRLCPVPV